MNVSDQISVDLHSHLLVKVVSACNPAILTSQRAYCVENSMIQRHTCTVWIYNHIAIHNNKLTHKHIHIKRLDI